MLDHHAFNLDRLTHTPAALEHIVGAARIPKNIHRILEYLSPVRIQWPFDRAFWIFRAGSSNESK